MIKTEYGQGSILYVKKRSKYRYAISDGVDENGKRKRIIHGNYDTREEAESQLKQALKERSSLLPKAADPPVKRSRKGHITVQSYLDKHLFSFYPKAKDRTKQCYMTTARYICVRIGTMYLDELTRLSLQDFLSSQDTLSTSMLNKIKILLKKMTATAYIDGLIEKDVGQTLASPTSKKVDLRTEEEKVYSMEQLQEILQAAKQETSPFLYTFLLLETVTGLRPEEMRGLYKEDIDYEAGVLHINRACTTEQAFDSHHAITGKLPQRKAILSTTKTVGGKRVLPLPNDVLQALAGWITYLRKAVPQQYESKLLFPNKDGSIMRDDVMETKFRRFAVKQGYDKSYTLYRFRHTFATNALRTGVDIKSLQMMMGHRSAEMIMRVYAHAPINTQLAEGRKLNKVYEDSLECINTHYLKAAADTQWIPGCPQK